MCGFPRTCVPRIQIPREAELNKGLFTALALIFFAAYPIVAQDTPKPVFARIAISNKSIVYIQIKGSELRAAMSVEGLQNPAVRGPLKIREIGSSEYVPPFEFTLPVPADQLPAGMKAIKASLSIASAQAEIFVGGELRTTRTDAHSVEWEYVSRVNTGTSERVKDAPNISLPDLGKPKAILEARTSEGKLALGIRLSAGIAELIDVRKNGHPVQVNMVVTDASGAQVASKVGVLSDFGFS